MAPIAKKVEKFLKNPTSSKYPDIQKVLEHFGFEKVPGKGSHIKFKHLRLSGDLVIPVHNNDCKNFYKREAKKAILKIKK